MPIDADHLSSVVASIYDCATDPALWPRALKEIADFIEGENARMFTFNVDHSTRGIGWSLGIDPEFDDLFNKDVETLTTIKYGFIVSEMDRGVTLFEYLGLYGGRDSLGHEYLDNRLYKDYMAPRGYHDTLAALMFKTESAFGGLAMARHARLPMFGAEDKEKMALIGPHIRRAWTIADLVERRTVERDRFAAVIEHLAAPIAIVEPDGVILHLNRAAQQLVESGDVLRAENHKLLAADRQSRAALQTLLKSGYAGQARSSVIARKSGGEVIASALPLMVTTGATDDGPTAVFFHTPDKSPQLPGETLAKLYRLTGTELRILHDLVNGASVQQMAESSGSQVSTIRFHLRNLFEKTGTTRQSELVKLALSAIPPVKAP